MSSGIYTSLSGGMAKSHEVELIANNLANANTPGFKRDTGTFNEYLTGQRRPDDRPILPPSLDNPPPPDNSLVELNGVYTDFGQGHLERTHRPLDVAIEGKGFFEVLTPTGVRYSRQGNFSLSPDGTLVTVNGFPVLSRSDGGGDPQSRIIKLGQGAIEITPDGTIRQKGQNVATLGLTEFRDPKLLEKRGNAYYLNTVDGNGAPATQSRLSQGFIEGSNVNPVSEMTRLIEATRAYESHLQAIKTYQEIEGKTANDIARP